MPVSLIAMVVVSLMTAEPDAETQAMVDEDQGSDRGDDPGAATSQRA